ncbi:hypothetical protein ACN4EK_16095 [Pantanalinema rosaneae CENA516]|uniref:hypothetical protein n=1 Tax=Pantanalinema rosaneae TaxID=1620701 RepID=UPI003D6F12B2
MQSFYDKHGRKAIVLAQFMPVVRTLMPFFAGIGVLICRIFVAYNIIGDFFWTLGITLLSYFLGVGYSQCR